MREGRGDIFKLKTAAICVTTNGITKTDGTAVMGAGVARVAADRYPGISKKLGLRLQSRGNHCHLLHRGAESPWEWEPRAIVAFPTKQHWRDPSPIELVLRSARELRDLTDSAGWESVALPRPGCGLGGLDWEELRHHLEEIWDERFWVSSGPR